MAVDVESLINSNWSRAVARAESIAATTQSLVSFAAGVMSTFQPNYPQDPLKFSKVRPPRDPTNPLPPFIWYPQTTAPSFPEAPTLPTIDKIAFDFKASPPELHLPDFRYRQINPVPDFADPAPSIDAEIDVPKPPIFGQVVKPNLIPIDPDDYHLDRLVVPPFDPKAIEYTPGALLDFRAAFVEGKSALPADIDDSLILLDKALPGLAIGYKALSDRINGVLERKETALGADFDAALFESLRQKVETETRTRLQELDDSRAGGWQMPSAARFAAQQKIQIAAQQASNQAALQVYLERRKTELQHLQFVMGLCGNLIGALGTLIAQLHNNHLEAFKAAIGYAGEAVRYSQAAYALFQHDAEIRVAVMESEIRLFEAKLKAQLAKVEILKTEFGFKAEINDDLLKQYLAELSAEESLAKTYVAHITGLKALVEARKLPLDVYVAKIQAHTALVEGKKAEYGIVMAEIDGDKARMEGERTKLAIHETEVKTALSVIETKAQIAQGQREDAKLLLEKYTTQVQAELSRIRADTEISGQTLDAYKSRIAAYAAENETSIRGAQLEFDATLESAKLELERIRYGHERELRSIELELGRKRAVAEVNGQMAQVMGQMTNAAQSALHHVLSANETQSS